MVPSKVSEKPMRRPEKISGSAAGSRMCSAVCAGVSRSAWPVRSHVRLTLRTAFMVNSAIGMMPCSAPNATLAGMPSPNSSRITG